ncbi:MAG: fumarylacetoacetate hydrolase family protein [Thalassobaculum sp.]|uniref:fumarylacetoacetate hydrolase family protein n=1 Tax=Thalassobaculum sp. TaxID=2022740 RepID=UPI0032EE8B73
MKLATFTEGGRTRIGVVEDDRIADVSAVDPSIPADMTAFLKLGPAGRAALDRALASAPRRPLAEVRLEAPVLRPGKFLAVGLNFADHIKELGAATPAFPSTFAKTTSCINGPYDPVHRPRVSDTLDYEGELGMVIGRRCRHVPKERALEVVAGYVVVNDLTVREWVNLTPQVVIPKSFDTTGPFGPWITTADAVPDPQALAIRTTVNGEIRQSSSTAEMIFGCADLIALLSQAVTLEPGDVITTGTPPGVGEGFAPKRYLQPGDVVRVEIDGLGHIENPVIAEPQATCFIED